MGCDLRRIGLCQLCDAGWSSPVARQAHNLKAAGSNPAPATTLFRELAAGQFKKASLGPQSASAHVAQFHEQ